MRSPAAASLPFQLSLLPQHLNNEKPIMSIPATLLMRVAARLSMNQTEEHQLFTGAKLPVACIVEFPCTRLAVPRMLAGTSQNPQFYPTSKIDELKLSRWMSQPDVIEHELDQVRKVILGRWVATFIDIVQQRQDRLVQNSRRFVKSSQDQIPIAESRIATLEVLSKPSIFKFSKGLTNCRPLRTRTAIEHDNFGKLAMAVVFSLQVDVTIMDAQTVTIVIAVPGTLEGSILHDNLCRLDLAGLRLDTDALCNTMKDRATDLVKRADALASRYQARISKTDKPPALVVKTSKRTEAASVALLQPDDVGARLYNLKPAVRSARCA